MYCKYISRSLNGEIRCKFYKSNISLLSCNKNCPNFFLKRNKPIKKVSKNKITVTEETYNKVMQRDKNKCRLAHVTYNGINCNGGLELHHVRYRSEAKDLINEPTNCIILCNRHHRLVHSNKHFQQLFH